MIPLEVIHRTIGGDQTTNKLIGTGGGKEKEQND